MNAKPNPIIVVAGCTASGKSSIAIEIARKLGGEIVNADSRQLYKNMQIGTASPIPEKYITDKTFILEDVVHHLYNYVEPSQDYTVVDYLRDLAITSAEISEGKYMILTGGTGFYIDSYIFNYSIENEKIDPNRRKELEKYSITQLQSLVPQEIIEQLNASDRQNPRRLIRLIESAGRSLSYKGVNLGQTNSLSPVIEQTSQLKHHYFVVDIPKEIVNERITQRVDMMLVEGLVQENQELLTVGLTCSNTRALNAIGYKEFEGYFEGEKSLEAVREEMILHTRQYAKRQRTWFRRHKHAIRIGSAQEADDYLDRL